MKKAEITLIILLIIGCGLYGADRYWGVIKSREIKPEETPPPVIVDDSTYITVTAVGDCTFGVDVNYGGATSFESEMKNVNYDYTHFLKLVKPFFENDDLTIANFEGTLSTRGERQEKEYAFRGNPAYAGILTSSSVEAVNLANNHTYDYGEAAFSDTKSIMNNNGILWFEGKNFTITEIKGVKVGLVGVNALTYAGKTQFQKVIAKVREQGAELVIVSFHWGEESATAPNDTQINLAHLAVDGGADLIIGHHPHVLQGIEKYNGKYILYSLGNFCFGGHKNPADKDTVIFKQKFQFKDGKITDFDFAQAIPCSISSDNSRNNYQPIPLTGTEFERVRSKLIERSAGFAGIEDLMIVENISL